MMRWMTKAARQVRTALVKVAWGAGSRSCSLLQALERYERKDPRYSEQTAVSAGGVISIEQSETGLPAGTGAARAGKTLKGTWG